MIKCSDEHDILKGSTLTNTLTERGSGKVAGNFFPEIWLQKICQKDKAESE